jgi:hypothetical protein
MLTKVSYSQDSSDTNSVGTPDYPSGIPDMHTIHSLLHILTKLIARDKAMSTFELYSQTI